MPSAAFQRAMLHGEAPLGTAGLLWRNLVDQVPEGMVDMCTHTHTDTHTYIIIYIYIYTWICKRLYIYICVCVCCTKLDVDRVIQMRTAC